MSVSCVQANKLNSRYSPPALPRILFKGDRSMQCRRPASERKKQVGVGGRFDADAEFFANRVFFPFSRQPQPP